MSDNNGGLAGGALLVDEDTCADAKATYDYDMIVIGGGSGGLAAAKRATEHQKKVLLCDFVTASPQGTSWGLGGTCVNVGCIPKKLMHTAALHGEAMAHMVRKYGWSGVEQPMCDWATLKSNVDGHVKSLNWGYKRQLLMKGVKYLNARASFVDPHTVEAVDRRDQVTRVTARRIVLAMGGRPSALGIPGQEYAVTSDDIFKLATDPGKTLVVGGSYVALECAGFLTGIGRAVTVLMRSIPLRGFDQQMAELVVSHMSRCGTRVIRGYVPTSISKTSADPPKLVATWRNMETGEEATDTFDTVLVAVGRAPETARLNLGVAGVALSSSGRVVVDAAERTTARHIYAVGDIVEGGLELTPVAVRAGKLLADRLYAGGRELMSYGMVPTTVFTPLEYACVGLSEEAAHKTHGEDKITVYHTTFQPLEWTVPHLAHDVCYMKVIVNVEDKGRVVGFHLLSPNAGEIAQGVAVALQCGATKADFDRTVGIHPTIAEEMTTVRVTKASGETAVKSGC